MFAGEQSLRNECSESDGRGIDRVRIAAEIHIMFFENTLESLIVNRFRERELIALHH